MSVEEIDFFDPWQLIAAGPEPEALAGPTRWRTRRGGRPGPLGRAATSHPANRSDPEPIVAEEDLSPTGRLRRQAFARLRSIAARLSELDHEAVVFGSEDETPVRLELRLRPSRGPVAAPARAGSIIFEFRPEAVVVLKPLGGMSHAASEIDRQSYRVVDPAWIEARTLDFVEEALLTV